MKKNKVIRKLRNKIWFFLLCSFTGVMVFVLMIIYFSNSSFLQQHAQNLMIRDSSMILGLLIEGYYETDNQGPDAFAIKTDAWSETTQILGPLDISFEDAETIRYQIFHQVWFNRIRNRFLFRIPAPFVEFAGRHWVFAEVDSRDWRNMVPILELQEEIQRIWELINASTAEGLMAPDNFDEYMTAIQAVLSDEDFELFSRWQHLNSPETYFVFRDATHVFDQIAETRRTIYQAGALGFGLLTVILYGVSNLLVRPTKKAFQQQKQFIADASHELKTPLTIMKSNFAVLMANEHATVGSQKKWLGNMAFGMERMTSLTADLLLLAQLDSGSLAWEEKSFDAGKTLMQSLESLKPRIEEKNLSLTSSIEEGLILTKNADKITQVMVILLDNAIKYSEAGGWIRVEAAKIKGQVTIAVKNSGPGIPPNHLPRIFDRFYRADGARTSESKSYGLGLAIAKQIIERSGGRLNASSIENQETAFWFTLK